MKFSMEEGLETGITPELALTQLGIIAEAGVYDYFSISNGGAHAHGLQIPTMEMPEAYLHDFGKRAREVVAGRAAIVVGHRIRRLELAAGLIEDGAADVVAMTRSHLADPSVVRKALEEREDEIVRCSGQNECIVRALKARPVACLMNPVTGRELQWGGPLESAAGPKRVVVIGGGPAGIQASARLAERGHRVTLLEEGAELGGHLNLLKQLPNRTGWVGAVEDLVRPVLRRGWRSGSKRALPSTSSRRRRPTPSSAPPAPPGTGRGSTRIAPTAPRSPAPSSHWSRISEPRSGRRSPTRRCSGAASSSST